ncbi:MAG TPA: EamA family transporter [archaeon]|nr:EamA family transporter [archaeon]
MDYTWLIFALLSAFTAALVAIFAKIGLQGIDSNTATAIRAIIMAVFLIAVIAVQGKLGNIGPILANQQALMFIVFSGIAGALSWIFYFLAMNYGKVSQVVPIDRLSIVFAIVLAFVFLQEKISLQTGIGTAIVVAGAIIIALG